MWMRSPFCALRSALVSRWPALVVSLVTSQVLPWAIAGAASARAAQRAAPIRVRDLIQPRDVSVDDEGVEALGQAGDGAPSVVHAVGAREPAMPPEGDACVPAREPGQFTSFGENRPKSKSNMGG